MKKYFDRPPSTMGDWLVLAAGAAVWPFRKKKKK